MFYRKAAIEIEDVYVQDAKGWSWKELVKKSTISKRAEFLPTDAFEYDPQNFVYFRARSITANVPNGNGDLFDDKELETSYKTFVGKGFYIEHQSDSIEKAKGIILDSVWHPETKYVECLVAVDRQAYPEIARQIETGILGSVSMGCTVEEAECSLCHNIARTAKDLCVHMNPQSGAYCKGKSMPDGSKVYEINRKCTFTELSGVAQPADFEAHVFEVFASMQRNLLKHAQSYQQMKAKASGCPDGKCTLDIALSQLTQEERILLKAAIEKQALNVQSPTTFQGNPQTDSGAANPKHDIDIKSDAYAGPERRKAPPLKTRVDYGMSHECKCGGAGNCGNHSHTASTASNYNHTFTVNASCNCSRCNPNNHSHHHCTSAATACDTHITVTGESINEAMTPMPVKIENEIHKAVNDKIDAEIKSEVREQVDKMLGDLVNQVVQPIDKAVEQQIEESRDDVAKTVEQVADEIASPPVVSSPNPSIQYGPYATAAMVIDRAITAASIDEAGRTALRSGLKDIMKKHIGSIVIGPNHVLMPDVKGFRLYSEGKPTETVIQITNPEDTSPNSISQLREACLIDMKAD